MSTLRSVVRRAREVRTERREDEVRRFVEGIPGLSEMTMAASSKVRAMVLFVDEVVRAGLDGAVVECGVWRGGVSFAAARRLQYHRDGRPVWMFDSFEGLPPPEEVDGAGAIAWASDTKSPTYYDNCAAEIDMVRANAVALGVDQQVRLVKGWFDDTLPATRDEVGPIAILRIDADWHASVRRCLDELYDQVVPNGVVIFDDYYAWDGCAVAVHEFLGGRSLAHRLKVGQSEAYFRKT